MKHGGGMDIPSGLIDTSAIRRTGARTDSIHSQFKSGKLVRIRRGFYVEVSHWLDARPWERFAWSVAAATRSIPGAILCRESAALVSGIPVLRTPTHVELLTPHQSQSGRRKQTFQVMGDGPSAKQIRSNGDYPLRYYALPDSECETHGEFRCTGLLQTPLDISFSTRLSQALVVADGVARALWKRGEMNQEGSLLDVDAIRAALEGHPREAARKRAQIVLRLAHPMVESAGESYSRAAFQYLGFEQPVLQHEIKDLEGFVGRSDFWWPGQGRAKGVVGEFDGKAKYADADLRNGLTAEEVLYREKLREDRIRDLGYGFVRWGWAHVDNPERLRQKLLGAGLAPSLGASRRNPF